MQFFRNSLSAVAALALITAACTNSGGNTAAGGTGGTGSGTDSAAGGTDAATGGNDTASAGGTDTASNGADTGAAGADNGAADTGAAGKDTAVADTPASPDAAPADSKPTDTAGGDAAADTSKPFACTADADCKALSLGPCAMGKCDAKTGICSVEIKAEKSACTVDGLCGGTGTCTLGVCGGFTATCGATVCTPAALKCGDKISLDAAKMGAGKMGVYGCGSANWAGGETAYTLASDTTQAAVVELASSASWTVIDLAPNAAGTCAPDKCIAAGAKLVVGLLPGKARLLVVDSLGTGTATLTVTCSDGAPAGCGDGKCDAAGGESCGNCAKDCGACKDPCPKAETPGCKDNPCEACVCAKDSYCCKTAWDSTCIGECKDCNLGAKCGDGLCNGTETCSSCAKDCGACAEPPAPKCGDGKCDGPEHCGSCPQDCGKCGDYACVCKADSYCCKTAFDSLCQSACAKCAGGLCPKPSCGDGVCGGPETCTSCAKDCGACVVVCGDGKCNGGETKTTCPKDCTGAPAGTGCEGHCGGQSKEADGTACYCDDICAESGDCCADKAKFCP